jgi:multimeric flavodoxin WrbA
MPNHLLIIYHSQSGTSAGLALAAERGAKREASVNVRLRRAWDAGTTDLLWADALLLVAAENSGTLSGGMKDFLDRTYYPAQRRVNLACGLVISAGNDGRGARSQLERILLGYPMKIVAEPLVLRGELSDQSLVSCEELGQTLAAGLDLGIF